MWVLHSREFHNDQSDTCSDKQNLQSYPQQCKPSHLQLLVLYPYDLIIHPADQQCHLVSPNRKKIIIPGDGSTLFSNHCPRSLNRLTAVTQPAYFGITPASIYPHSFAHQLTKQAHHSTWELNPYHDQYGSPPIFPICYRATVTI